MNKTVKLCQDLVQYNSVADNIYSITDFVKDYLKKYKFNVEVFDCGVGNQARRAIYATIGTGKKTLLFNGHLDVVATGDKSLWKYAPFEAKIDDGILYGRGIADMKGSIATFISAVGNLLEQIKNRGKICILLSTDEEEPTVDTTKYVLDILSKRGEKFDFAIVGEPSNSQIIGEELKIGRRGDIVVNITSVGVRGHTAYPQLADNPIHNLLNLLENILDNKLDNGNEYFDPSSMQVTTFDVGNLASNVIPEKAMAQLDIRFNSEHTSKSIKDFVNQQVNKTKGNFNLTYDVVGESFLSPINDSVKIMEKAISEVCHIVPKYSTSGGTSDARFVRCYCPVVEFGLTNLTIHKTNECESIENIETLEKVYTKFLEYYFAL